MPLACVAFPNMDGMTTSTHTRDLSSRDSLLDLRGEPLLASHLVSPRMFYSHHGIYVGNGRVIHYAGLAYGVRRGPVEEVSLERFAQGHGIRIRHDERRFDRREVVERARSRLGERSYRLLTNNCEHFCSWALRNEIYSRQAERLLAFPRVIRGAFNRPRRQHAHGDQYHRAIVQALRLWWNRACGTRLVFGRAG